MAALGRRDGQTAAMGARDGSSQQGHVAQRDPRGSEPWTRPYVQCASATLRMEGTSRTEPMLRV